VKQLEELRSAIGDIVGEGTSNAPVSGKEWVKEEIPPHLWLVGNLIAAGTTTMLVAESGLGKTTMLTQLTISLSTGKQFCGMHCHGPTRTLTVAAEGARFAYRSRFIETCKSLNVAASEVNDWYIHPPNLSDYQLGSAGLRDMIRSCKPGVVILDTLGYFHHGDENDATEWKRYVMQPIRKLTEEFGCAFVLVHHTGKDMEKGGRGTSAQVADVDHYFILEHPNGTSELYRELYVRKNKYGRGGQRIPMRFDADRAVFSANMKEEPIHRDPLRAAIKKMVPSNV
jgi:RecA-family ATPase